MILLDALQIARLLIKKELQQNPEKQYKKKGRTISLKDVLDLFDRLISWVYPELTDEDIVKVMRCKQCRHHKKVKGDKYNTFKWVCALNGEPREDSEYCNRSCEE